MEMETKESLINSLRQILNLDLSKFLTTKLNEHNFLDYFHLVLEIFNDNSVPPEVKSANSDKLLDYCMSKLSLKSDFDLTKTHSIHDQLLKYIRLCAPYASKVTVDEFFKVYVVYFIKLLIVNKLHPVSWDDNLAKFLNLNRTKVDVSNEIGTGPNAKQINFLTDCFSLMVNETTFESTNSDDHKRLVVFLIDNSLKLLYELNDYDCVQLNKLAVNNLTKLASVSAQLKIFILGKIYNDYMKIESETSSSSSSNTSNDTKKRLESHFKNVDLNLLTSLADYFLTNVDELRPQPDAYFLDKSEYWILIQNGLCHTNSFTRKQALYLLKRTNDLASVCKLNINSNYVDSFANKNLHLYESSWTCWDDFYLCIELFEETSVHIIKPCLPKVASLIEHAKSGRFHYSWLLVLFNRGFIHESKFIVRWSVSAFLQSSIHLLVETVQNKLAFSAKMNSFIFKNLILILQKAYLYKKTEEASSFVGYLPKIAHQLSLFMNSYVNSLPNQQIKTEFLETLTSAINNYTWNATSLLFVSKSLFDLDVNSTQNLNQLIIKNVHKVVTCAITTQEVFVRSATQTTLTNFLIKHVQPSQVELNSLKCMVDYMNGLSSRECAMYLNDVWMRLIKWFMEIINTNGDKLLLVAYLNEEIKCFTSNADNLNNMFTLLNESNKLAKLILCLLDTNVEGVYKHVIELINERLSTCNKYLYMSTDKIERFLFIFYFMIDYFNSSNFFNENANSFRILKNLHTQLSCELIDFIIRRADRVDDEALNYENLLHYMKVLSSLFNFENKCPAYANSIRAKITSKIVRCIVPAIVSALGSSNSQKSFSAEWKKFIFVSVLACLVESNYSTETYQAFCSIGAEKILIDLVSYEAPSKSQLLKLDKNLPKPLIDYLHDNYSIFNAKYNEQLWIVYDFFLSHQAIVAKFASNTSRELIEVLIEKMANFIDYTSTFSLATYAKCCRNFTLLLHEKVNSPDYKDKLLTILKSIYQQIWEMKDDVKNFNNSLREFFQVLLTEHIMIGHQNDDRFKAFIKQISLEVLRKGIEKLSAVKPLVECFLKFVSKLDSSCNDYFLDVFITFIIYGDVYKKEKKYVQDIEIYIESLGANFGTNQLLKADYLNDLSVRLRTMFYLLTNTNGNLDQSFYTNLLDKFLEKDTLILDGNTKLYINSQVHRERFRLWQTILALFSKFNHNNNYDKLLDYCETILVTESQPSIRIMIEWMVLKILLLRLDKLDISSYLLSKLNQFTNHKVGYTLSWLTILTNMACLIGDENKSIIYLENLTTVVMSQILSSNFHLRTFVEAILLKIHNLFNEPYASVRNGLNSPSLLANQRVVIIRRQIDAIIKIAVDDQKRHSNILVNHFYFQFDPISDYTIESIYYWFPYLSGVDEEECVQIDCFLSIVFDKNLYELTDKEHSVSLPLSLRNESTKLKNCPSGVWKFTAFRDESLYESNVSVEDLQKKIIPWHLLVPTQQDLDDLNTRKKLRLENAGGLILVSTLIDKGTNLGGISRTCEIFNVRELIVGSIRHLEDKNFQTLSVTSEKWLNIKEVPFKYLKTYLLEMKYNGYCLIGLEQTANSVQLNEFSFPRNSLLILGNEKEGLPIDLIQMLDYCVEIPQLGVIRSLNVHVTAAIAIWEYTKQHLIKTSS